LAFARVRSPDSGAEALQERLLLGDPRSERDSPVEFLAVVIVHEGLAGVGQMSAAVHEGDLIREEVLHEASVDLHPELPVLDEAGHGGSVHQFLEQRGFDGLRLVGGLELADLDPALVEVLPLHPGLFRDGRAVGAGGAISGVGSLGGEITVDLESPVPVKGAVGREEQLVEIEGVGLEFRRGSSQDRAVENIPVDLLHPAADVEIEVPIGRLEMEAVSERDLEINLSGPGGRRALGIEAQTGR
jgi:hypothetical protein